MAKMNVFTLNNLSLYDELLKAYISEQDAMALKTVAIDGNTLKFYKVTEPVGDTAPAYEITLPETDISGLIPKITSATKGNVVIANADGTVADGGVALSALATKEEVNALDGRLDVVEPAIEAINNTETGILAQAKSYADGKDAAIQAAKKAGDDAAVAAKKAQDEVDALELKVGTVPEGSADVIAYIDKKTSGIATDAALGELQGKVAQAEADIDALEAKVGDKTVDKAIDDKITALNLGTTYEPIGKGAEEAGKVQDALDAYIESNDAKVAKKANSATTLAGYGITDAMTADEIAQAIEDAQYDDTKVKEDIQANADAIAKEKARMDAFMKLEDGQTLNDALDSLKELQDYITNEAADADVVVGKVAALEAILDGIGGEGEEATVVAYVTKAIEALKIGDYAKAADLNGAIERIAANEQAVAGLGDLAGKDKVAETDLDDALKAKVHTHTFVESELNKIADGDVAKWNTAATKASANETAIAGVDGRVTTAEGEIDTLQSEMDTVEGKVSALEGLVGEGYAEIAEQDIRNLFA